MESKGYGSGWTAEKYLQLYYIWAEAMDEWCEPDGMGRWDFYLYGNEHFNYSPYDVNSVTTIPCLCSGWHDKGWFMRICGSKYVWKVTQE